MHLPPLHRRTLLRASAGLLGTAALSQLLPSWAQAVSAGIGPAMPTLSGEHIALTVGHSQFKVNGRTDHAVTINGTLPAPLLRLREGQDVRISVTNTLPEDTSIHWHGLLLPFHQDGVPGLSFPGIAPGETFTYAFPIRQSGTYWYHSHSGMQEAMGHFGPIIIDPATPDPIAATRDHIVVLSDWSHMHPHKWLHKLKASSGYFNRQKQDIAGLLAGADQNLTERLHWAQMLMDPTDISDVTGATLTYLVNGHDSQGNWTGLFTPGERVRLRIINAAAMTNFNVRLPGLAMTVVAVDGLPVEPVEIDEFQIAIAETYDVIVTPRADAAYALIAEAIDRSGLVRATLAPRAGMQGALVPLRARPLLSMKDMGMDMSSHQVLDLSQPEAMAPMDHSMDMRDPKNAPQVKMGPGVASISPMPMDRTADRPTGLEKEPHRVLTYAALKAAIPFHDQRAPTRNIDVHLTANMERYMWSMDGETFSEHTEPLLFAHHERVRINLINDTMMPHPIHMHGHFFEVVNGQTGRYPIKHTVNVLPGSKVSILMTADALGDWAFHCHMMLHMETGMFRIVKVRSPGDKA